MVKQAKIHDWQKVSWFGYECLLGRVEGHDKQHEFKSRTQITSPLVWISDTEAQTENTLYVLGNRRGEDG